MSLTARDKKLVLILVPIVLLLAYWFLILGPQRSEVSALTEKQTAAETARDASVATQQRLAGSKSQYASDYATVVRLGKAIPSTLDMPSLLVQLESAAKGTGIDFDSITVGERTTAATPAAASSSSGSAPAPVESGGQQAKSGPGTATEKANEGADKANQAAGASGGTTPSQGAPSTTASSVPGLDTVALTFSFQGRYFELANFLHRVKRFVRVANDDIKVKGRLMTVDDFSLSTGEESFTKINAELGATIYLSPKTEGATGGGTPQGPTATPASAPAPAGGTTTPPSTAPTQSSGSGAETQ